MCCEDYIIYKHQGAKEHRVPIPKRSHPLSDPERGVIITSAVMHKMRVSSDFSSVLDFHLLHSLTLDFEQIGRFLLPVTK